MNFFSINKSFLPPKFFAHYFIISFIYNTFYLLFFFFVLLSISGSLFEVNSNFLLFFTFTFFLYFFNILLIVFLFFFFSKSDQNIILNNINILINSIVNSLFIIKLGVLNNNIILFKNIFMYIKSFHILFYINLNSPCQINLNLKNYILSSLKTNE